MQIQSAGRIYQPQSNYSPIPHVITDYWLPRLKPHEFSVLIFICRKCWGWQKTADKISMSQMEKGTGLEQRTIRRSTKALEKLGLIKKIRSGAKGFQQVEYTLIIFDNPDNSNNLDPWQNATPPPGRLPPTKETIQNKEGLYIYARGGEGVPEDPPQKSKSHSPPPLAMELTNYLLTKLKEYKPNLKAPNITEWAKGIDQMLRIDKRTKEETVELIDWVYTDRFWAKVVLSASNLRKNFDKIQEAMKYAKELKSLKVNEENIKANRSACHTARGNKPKHFNGMKIFTTHVVNNENGKDLEFDMDHVEFRKKLLEIFKKRAE